MLKIRLQRIGKRGQAYFRVVVTEHTKKPQGKYLELLGSYDPHKNQLTVDGEKVKHWLSQGAKMSETVNNLLVGRGVIEGEKVRVWKPKPSSRGHSTELSREPQAEEKKPAASEQTAAPTTKPEEKKLPNEKVKNEEPMPEVPKEEIAEEKKEEIVPAIVETPAVN